METGLAAFSGTDFLWLYCGLFAAAVAASYGIGSWLRQDGRFASALSMEELAILNGGDARYAEAVTARLVGIGALDVDEKRGFVVRDPAAGQNSAERAILCKFSPIRWKDVTAALKADASAVREDLVRKGLMIDSGEAMQLRFFQALPLLLLFALGMFRLQAGNALGEPVGILTALLIVTFIAMALRFAFLDRRTRAGNDAIREATQQHSRLERAPQGEETGHAVALYGTGVLAGTSFAAFHTMRQNNAGGGDAGGSSDSDGGGDSGGDGGGDGGCGGGCGGCGG